MAKRHAILVVDLAFGDCGKGTMVDYLTRSRRARAVVRFNGGPQAGHNVVTPDGRHHTFSQLGSGTFVPGVRTFLSRFVLIEPYALLNETAHLNEVGVTDATDRLLIDHRCVVITPAHQAANRLRELARGAGAHGTCGMGVGEAMADHLDRPDLTLQAGELSDRAVVRRKLRGVVEYKVEQLRDVVTGVRRHPGARASVATLQSPGWIDAAIDTYAHVAARARVVGDSAVRELLCAPGTVLFEGAQGVLLDEWFGFHPHTTWSTTTFANAEALLDDCGYEGVRTRVGVLRSYFTRHGAGPLVSEDLSLAERLPEPHNGGDGWQGRFRVGAFDAVAARYALAVAGGADVLAVTHVDRLPQAPAYACTAYRVDGSSDAAECDALFTRRGGQITDIRVDRPADLARQERLTRWLGRCRAVRAPLPNAPEWFVRWLERELRTPVGIVSAGPTAVGKRESKGGASVCAARRPVCPLVRCGGAGAAAGV